MKYLIPLSIFTLLLIMLASFKAGASSVTNNYYYTSEDLNTQSIVGNDDYDRAMAMSAAGDTCIFDYASGWQGCGGMGWYGNAQAINGSAAMRVDQFMLRFNLQSDDELDEFAGGVGASWHF